jgi:hypothetical protein
MGIFSKITKSAKGIVKNPTDLKSWADFGIAGATAGQIDTDGVNLSAFGGKDISIKDLMMGKKAKDINPDDIANQIRATQSKGLTELNSALDTPSADIVRAGADSAKKSILSSAQDARIRAQGLMVRTGLKGSSLGLASNRSIDQATGNDIANVNAALPGQIRDQKIKDAMTRANAGGINQNGINFNTIEGQRSGGVLGYASALAPLAGTVAGFAVGGPAGGAMGSQVGQGMSQGFNKIQKPNLYGGGGTGNYSNYS